MLTMMIKTGLPQASKHHVDMRELYLTSRNNNNLKLKRHYQVYCKILSNIIKEAKRIYYDKKNPKI